MKDNDSQINPGRWARTWLSDWGGVLTLGSVLFTGWYVVWVTRAVSDANVRTLVTDIAQPAISLLMTILAWRASRQKNLEARNRRAWAILAIAFFLYFTGNLLWSYYEVGLGQDLALSWADVPYLLYYPIALVGLLYFHLDKSRSRLTFALDASTVIVGAAMVIWYLVLRPIASAEHVSTLEASVTLAYPIGNAVLLFGVIAISMSRPNKAVQLPLAILMIAIFFDAIADFGYSYQTLQDSYAGGGWPDCFYMIGFTLMGLSAQLQVFTAKRHHASKPVSATAAAPFDWLPYAAIAIAYGLLVVVCLKHSSTSSEDPILSLVLSAFVITGLVVARQIVAVRENSRLLAEKAMRANEQRFISLVQHSLDAIAIMKPSGKLVYLSPSVEDIFGYPLHDLLGTSLLDRIHPDDQQTTIAAIASVCAESGKSEFIEAKTLHQSGNWLDIEAAITNLTEDPHVGGIVINSRNVTERKRAQANLRESEQQLRRSQKLESIGQLAAGIAHEINTPTQYVGDNLRFIQEAYHARSLVMKKYGELFEAAQLGTVSAKLLDEIGQAIKEADLEYVAAEAPRAIKESLEGLARIAKIVQSMKDFAHPDSTEKKAADLNRAIESTINVARGEWKYVAEIETNFDPELPFVPCLLGELNQVTLNMIINSAHAIAEKMKLAGSEQKGVINITTRHEGDWAVMRISDTGMGIPLAIRDRIFDPFFTTKEVGKGTGQGLAISHTVVEKHGGSITFETAEGEGTTFSIRLPLHESTNKHSGLKEAA